MPQMDDLPPELIDDIVSHGSYHAFDYRTRYRELKSFARVSPTFRLASQRLLNDKVVLNFDRTARLWLGNRWQGNVREVRMWMGLREGNLVESGVRDDTAAEIIRACPNLEVLELPGSRADVRILEEPNLRSLRTLFISFESDRAPPPGLRPACKYLKSLTVANFGQHIASSVVTALLNRSRQTLRSFAMRNVDSDSLFLISHRAFGRSLRSLDIGVESLDDHMLYPAFFASTTSLVSLTLDAFPLRQIAKALVKLPKPTLTRLRFPVNGADYSHSDSRSFQQVEKIILLPSLKNLKRLELHRSDRSAWNSEVEMKREMEVIDAWIAVWKGRGLVIHYERRL